MKQIGGINMKISTNYQTKGNTTNFKGNFIITRLPLALEPDSGAILKYGQEALRNLPCDMVMTSGLDRSGNEVIMTEIKIPDGKFIHMVGDSAFDSPLDFSTAQAFINSTLTHFKAALAKLGA